MSSTSLPPNWARPKISNSALDHIGNTPLIRINKLSSEHECEILAKCEFFNAGGSVKDRIGKRMILDAEKSGRIKPGDTLIEPTSGNTGIGLAITALIRGYRIIITLPEKMSNEKMNMLKALGAEIIRTPTEAAWDAPESHIGVAKKLHAQIPNSHILDQYENPSNPLAHYEGTAEEILHQCDGRLDMIVCGAGTGGTISGVARKLKEALPNIKVVGVDPLGSILAQPEYLNTPAPPNLVEGIGYDFIPHVLNRSLVDEWIKTDDACSLKMARRLIKEEGLMCGGSSGAAMHACLLAAKNLGRGKRVVVILPDSTRNYMTKFLSDEWMVEKGIEPPSLLTKGPTAVSALLADGSAAGTAEPEWWESRTVVDLNLPSPITVPPSMLSSDAAEIMREHSIDQLPVVDDTAGVVGVVTLGNLSSKILSRHALSSDPVAKVMFTTFTQVPLGTQLGAFGRIFERNAYCLVVTPMRHLVTTAAKACAQERKVVVGVCTQVDLLKYVMQGNTMSGASQPPHAPSLTGLSTFLPAMAPAKPKWTPTNAASDLSRGPHELDCSSLAWAFMKPPRSAPPASPLTRLVCADVALAGRGEVKDESRSSDWQPDQMACAQLAWAFMRPPPLHRTTTPRPSPYLETTPGNAGPPTIDLSSSGSQEASAAATAVASPYVAPTSMGNVPKIALTP